MWVDMKINKHHQACFAFAFCTYIRTHTRLNFVQNDAKNILSQKGVFALPSQLQVDTVVV